MSDDVLVLSEPDERFELNVRASRSGGLVVIWSASRDTTEVWVVDAHDPRAAPRSVGGRRVGVEYHAEHAVLPDGTEVLLLVTNDEAQEFRLARCPGAACRRPGPPRMASRSATRIRTSGSNGWMPSGATPCSASAREDGTGCAWCRSTRWLRPGSVVDPAFEDGTVVLAANPDFASTAVTVCDQSYVQPPVWSDVDLGTGRRTERHRQPAPGHDPDRYLSERLTFAAPDGTEVPVTLVRHRDTPLDGTAPALVYGYGAYEYTFEPDWDPALPSLLDRGVVFAHAHVRGGGEGGRRWWLDGRLARKQNTFTDHLTVADGLAGLVDGHRLASRGLSAGGLLQGVVLSPAAGPLGGRGRGGAVRRRGHHDVRRVRPAHGHGVGRVGGPAPPGGVRLAARLLAVRQPPACRAGGRTCW